MIVTIQNPKLTVEIDTLGAQLASVRAPDGTEYLWQGDPAIWARRAPILFPFIGRLKDNSYLLDGVPYTIPTHGFARDMEFQVSGRSDTSVSLRLTHTEETLKRYPFPFFLTVTYTLEDNTLVKTHRVDNPGDRPMLYELGAHDGFRASAADGWSILLPGVEELRPYGMDQALLLTPPERTWPLSGGQLALTPWVYGGLDTVILDAPAQARAVLADPQGRPRVTVSFPDFPYIAFWTANKGVDSGYVCIEPWSALPDATFVGRELRDKRGVRCLAPGKGEELSYRTTIHS